MAFGFPASYREIRGFEFHPEELSAVIGSIFEDLGWQHKALTGTEFTASVPVNLASWGEEISVVLLANGFVEAESKCSYPLQCFDWGKNKENIQTFFAYVETRKGWQIQTAVAAGKIPAAFDEKGFSPVERIFSETDDE